MKRGRRGGLERLRLWSRPEAKAWHQPQQEEADKHTDNDIRHLYSRPETGASANQPSIHFLISIMVSPTLRVVGALELIPAVEGEGGATPWTRRQYITVPHCDKHHFGNIHRYPSV